MSRLKKMGKKIKVSIRNFKPTKGNPVFMKLNGEISHSMIIGEDGYDFLGRVYCCSHYPNKCVYHRREILEFYLPPK